MSLARETKKAYEEIGSVEELTIAFENIASTRIQHIKDKVLTSKDFFAELWNIYRQLRVLPEEEFSHGAFTKAPTKDKEAIIIVTSRGKLSGEIDHKIVTTLMREENVSDVDIISVGRHGQLLLEERSIKPVKVFDIPEGEYLEHVNEIISFTRDYKKTSVYYETYVSLAVQEIKKIDLVFAIQEMTEEERKSRKKKRELIHKEDYIFEPTYRSVMEYIEGIMLKIALSQVLLESTLAQQASRFKAMHSAHDRAEEIKENLGRKYNRARRAEKDARLKEIISSLINLKHEQ